MVHGSGTLSITFLKVLAVCDSVKWEITSNAGSTARLSFFFGGVAELVRRLV